MHPIYTYIRQELSGFYPDAEAAAMAKYILTEKFQLSALDLYAGKDMNFSSEKLSEVNDILARLKSYEPLQYIIGETWFCGFRFKVTPAVLIPRPETAELIDWIVEDGKGEGKRVLDIGTGSGCIPVSLALMMDAPVVSAWDISEDALAVADYVVGGQEYFDGTGKYEDIKATAIDDYTFEVVLKNATPFFPQLVANDVYLPIKQEVVEKAGEGWEKKPETAVSNGPFFLEEYQVGSHMLFKKNPNYYAADEVKLPGIKAVIIADDNTAYQAYQAVTVYLNMLYRWELGNFVLAFEGMFLLLLLCNAGISWSGVSAEWKHTKMFVEEGEALQSQIFVRNRLCIPVCKLRIDLSYQYAGEEKKRKERLWVAVRASVQI